MKPFENTVGKGEYAGNQHFVLFEQIFSTLPKRNFSFSVIFILLSASSLNLDQSKNVLFSEGLTQTSHPLKSFCLQTELQGLGRIERDLYKL